MIPEDERVLGFFLPQTQQGPGEECDPGACTGLKYSSVMTMDENYGGEVRGRSRSLGSSIAGRRQVELSPHPPTHLPQTDPPLGAIPSPTLAPCCSGKRLIAQAWVYGKWIRDSFLSC